MATFTVTDDILNSNEAEAYFTGADRRVMIGLRATLEILRLPVPEYAKRRKPGPTPAKAVAAAFSADHPSPLPMALRPRKAAARSETVAAAQSARAARLGRPPSFLFNQVFPDR